MHATAFCLAENLRKRAATCSPNELSSSRSEVSFSICETSNSSRLSAPCFFLRFCCGEMELGGGDRLGGAEDLLGGAEGCAGTEDSMEGEVGGNGVSDLATLLWSGIKMII